MSRDIRLSPGARTDLTRLAEFLAERDRAAAGRAVAAITGALMSLADFAERAPIVDAVAGVREMRVKFGRYGYAIQYRVDADSVLVSQIFHVREAR